MARSAVTNRLLIRNYDNSICNTASNFVTLSSFAWTPPFSVACWFKTTQTALGTIFSIRAASDNLFLGTDLGKIYGFMGGGGGEILTNKIVVDGYWHHVVLTIDGLVANVYVDGALSGSANQPATMGAVTIAARILIEPNTGNPLAGSIQDFQVYNKVLSAAEAANIYFRNITASGLTDRYLFIEGSGTSAANTVGSMTATLSTSALWTSDSAMKSRSTPPVYQNLFQRSSEFDNAYWTKDATALPTITANQVANPLTGAVDADLMTEGVGSGLHRIYSASFTLRADIPFTFSAYVKDNDARYFSLNCDGSSEFAAVFDLTTGVISGQSFSASFYTNVFFAIEAVPGQTGWYRCSATMIAKTNRAVFLAYGISGGSAVLNLSHAGTGKSLYIWGAQYAQTNWATSYVATTSAAIDTGTLRNRALVSQNQLLYSSDFTQSNWTKQTGVVITADQIANPITGGVDADLIDFTAASVSQGVFQTKAGNSGFPIGVGKYNTKSVWLKGVLGTEVVTLVDPSFTGSSTTCNLTTSWQRFSLTEAVQSIASGLWIRKSSGNQFYAYGAQLVLANWEGLETPTSSMAIQTPIRSKA